ncbi:MAG TPA: hypothetical protein VGU66_15075 [Candidatus Elarobacter sp.]|nr:hypothetical protein [Candidatus Elarobacter sp.]
MQQIGRRLDRAVHLTVRNAFVLCVPFVVAELGATALDALTSNDWNGYLVWLVVASLLEIWARVAVVCALRDMNFARALGAALRRPALLLYVVVACAEPWLLDISFNLWSPLLFAAGSLVVFASMLALVDSVAHGVSPGRAFAYWLREMCRWRRLGVNLVGALVAGCLVVLVPDILSDLPWSDTAWASALLAVAYGVGDAFAMVFVVLWYEAALDERYGRDIEHVLDGRTPAGRYPLA